MKKALATGARRVTFNGLLDRQKAVKWYQENVRLTAKRMAANGASTPSVGTSRIPTSSVSASRVLSTAQRYQLARAQNEENKAQLSSLELEARAGSLASVDHMKKAAFECARRVRDRLLALPDRLAARLAATDDPAAVHELLTSELEGALQSIGQERVQ